MRKRRYHFIPGKIAKGQAVGTSVYEEQSERQKQIVEEYASFLKNRNNQNLKQKPT